MVCRCHSSLQLCNTFSSQYIPVNFDKEDFREALFADGYNKTVKTLFIWEGVTYYVTAEAVDETLAFVAANSGSGSSIIFDYVFRRSLDAVRESRQGRRFMRFQERLGEPLLFGIAEDSIEELIDVLDEVYEQDR